MAVEQADRVRVQEAGAPAPEQNVERQPVPPPLPECPCERQVPETERRYPGAPIPTGLLIALGDRRTGQWSIGLATAVVLTVVLYWRFTASGVPGTRLWTLVVAAAVGLGAGWYMSGRAAAIRRSTDAYPEQEQEIRNRCAEAWARLPAVGSDAEAIRRSLRRLDQELVREGPQWLDGAGYLDAWDHLHNAEENLLLIDTTTEVTATGLNDLLRLHNSRVAAKSKLIDELKEAIPHLSSTSGSNLNPPLAQPNPCDPDSARRRIKNVRAAINQDRAGKWRQVIKARNGLGQGVLATAVITYAMVAVAVVVGLDPRMLISAGVFYGVGAAVSAAHQLTLRSRSQGEIEDFGYANVKLLVAPALAGLVAVLAVATLAQASVSFGNQTYGAHFESWQATFDWTRNPDAIWVAAVFGFAPSLLFAIFQARVNGVLDSLKSSQPSGGKGGGK